MTAGPAPSRGRDPLEIVVPQYGRSTLAEIMPGVLTSLRVGTHDPLGLAEGGLGAARRVIVLLVDGMGSWPLTAAADHAPVLAHLLAGDGCLATTVTAPVPSTTPTSLVTLGTGRPPGATGVLGFTVRNPDNGIVFSHVEWKDDPEPGRWQPVPSQFQLAAAAGIETHAITRDAFAGTGLTLSAYGSAYGSAQGAAHGSAHGSAYGAVRHSGAANAEALATRLLETVRRAEGPALVYGYHPELDSAGHRFGVESQQWREALGSVDRMVGQILDGLPADTALVVTADHGQLDVPPEGRFDCGNDDRLANGLAAVAGEPRMRHLYPVPGAAADVLAAWRQVLAGQAIVLSRDEAIDAGWFGAVAPEHRKRVGEVVMIANGRCVVLASGHEPPGVAGMVGFHGSATSAEMLVPLLVAGSVTGRG